MSRHSPRTLATLWVRLLHERTLLLLVLVFFGGSIWVTWSFARLSSTLVQTAAIEDADTITAVIGEFRSLYTSEVVERVRPHGIDVTHEYESTEGSIPLPATLSMKLGEEITSSGVHGSVRLFSDHPFPWREDGGPRDDFEREALRQLRSSPEEPFYRLEDVDGHYSLRYAIADRMRASCVDCHNTHPQSPKVDWEVGDVRGVLQIIRPVDGVTAATHAAIREFFIYLVLLALVALVGLTYVLRRMRNSLQELRSAGLSWELEAEDEGSTGFAPSHLILLETLALVSVLVFDLYVPLGVAAGVLYVLAVLLSIWSPRQSHTYGIAVLASCLTLAGLALSPEGGEIWKVLANRILAIFAIWITAVICIWQKRAMAQKSRMAAEKRLAYSHNEELREAKARTEAILEAAVDGIITIDEGGIIESVNPSVETIFGYSSDELIGENVSRLMPSPDREHHDQYLRNYLRTGQSKIIGIGREVVGLRKNGSSFPADLSIGVVESNKGRLFTGIVRNISRRKEAERKLDESMEQLATANQSLEESLAQVAHANAELAQRNSDLDEFTHVASHDLQAPLRNLIAFSDLLESDLGEDLTSDAEKDLHFIKESARRMSTLVQDLLRLSRSGRSAMKMEPVPLQDCVDRALEALGQRIEETGAEIVCEELPMVRGDTTLLTQLYQNLIGNALKFVPEERKPVVRLSATDSDEGWVCVVEDKGIGIEPAHRDTIFSPFQRLHGRDAYEGSGIGLSICRKSVERHGGRIWVESTPEEGCRFLFTLPANPVELRPTGT